MEELLFLSHRIPFPPNKGDKIRSWNILRHLAGRYRVHLGCFVDCTEDLQYIDRLRGICDETYFGRLSPGRARLASLGGLVTGSSLSVAYYRDRSLRRWVDDLIARRPVTRAFVFSSSMAQYVVPGVPGGPRRILDFVDLDSEKWREYSQRKPWPESWLYAHEARKLRAFECRAVAQAEVSLFVSEAEAAQFRAVAPQSAARTDVLMNGVDMTYFDPAQAIPNPFSAEHRNITFTGAMDYWPNVDAVCWFTRQLLPEIRKRQPAAHFWIVGANPAPEVARLAENPDVTVTGRVTDIRPYLRHADIVVAPLRVARGVQNKVLEAMSLAKTVIATANALEGLDAVPGRDVIAVDGPADFVAKAVEALDNNGFPHIGRAARVLIEGGYGWATRLGRLEAIVEGAVSPAPAAAPQARPVAPPVAKEA